MAFQFTHLATALCTSAALLAQSPLTTTFSSDNGQNGCMFDVRAGAAPVVINDFDVNLDSGTWDLEIYTVTSGGSHVGNEQNAAAWTLVASIPGVVSAGVDQPTSLGQSLAIQVPCSTNVGIYISTTTDTPINYTTGTGIMVGEVIAANTDLEILAGVGNANNFGTVYGPPDASRNFSGSVYYTVQAGVCATANQFGTGCGQRTASWYERMSPGAMDLGGMMILGTHNGDGYDISVVPSAIVISPTAQQLTLGDDDEEDSASVGGTLGIHVGSNCWIALGSGNSTGFEPRVNEMLNNGATGIYAWTDLLPLQSSGEGLGVVLYEESGTVAKVTYDGVEGWNTNDPNTVQISYDTATQDFSIAFGTVSTINPEDWLIGFSTGGASINPGSTDISAAPFSVAAIDVANLALTSNEPVVGTNWDIQMDKIDNSAFGFFAIGAGDTVLTTPLDLATVGAPGCWGYIDGNIGVITSGVTAGSSSCTVAIPASSSFVGLPLTSQGAALNTYFALGLGTSNAISAVVGN